MCVCTPQPPVPCAPSPACARPLVPGTPPCCGCPWGRGFRARQHPGGFGAPARPRVFLCPGVGGEAVGGGVHTRVPVHTAGPTGVQGYGMCCAWLGGVRLRVCVCVYVCTHVHRGACLCVCVCPLGVRQQGGGRGGSAEGCGGVRVCAGGCRG